MTERVINKDGVSTNPALVEFPQDPWGFTAKLRKIGLQTASNVRGNEEKMKLFMETLQIIAKHAQARYPADQAAMKTALEDLAKRDEASRQIEEKKE